MQTPKKPKMFKRYKNLSGDSKIAGYEIAKDSLVVRFADCSVYKYTNQSVGPDNIGKMKVLAQSGKGLGTFMNASMTERFTRKIR